ncbi:MAG: zinc transport system ATP-binding protein [Phycisphaerales bacterium]|jgi:zinc transport system ATP-binding protein
MAASSPSPISTADQTPALRLRGVGFAYPGTRADALQGVTIEVSSGERLGVLGPNGGGKSTLLKLILGLLEPREGTVEVCGRAPSEARRAGLVGYLPQKVDAGLDWPLTVRQVVMMPSKLGLRPWQRVSEEARSAADRAIDLVGMGEHARTPIGKLSGGQVQRAMIARAVAGRPRVLLLDEPTVGVDVVGQRRFGELIQRLHNEMGLTVITVSHDLSTVAATSDRVACLRRTLHFHDAPAGLTPQVLAEVFSHDVEAVFGEVHIDAHTADECSDPTHTPTHGHSHEHPEKPGGGA